MEESDHFKPEITRLMFEDTHIIQDCIVDAVQFGFANYRRRYWAVLFHRLYVKEVGNS
jgi:hypothetical protein